MRTMKGPGIFLSQFIGGEAPFNTLDGLAGWAAGKGYKAVQIPCNHPHIFDVEKAAESQAYCDEIAGKLAAHGLVISELSTHLEGQLVAVNPVYSEAFDHFAPAFVRGNEAARQAWATEKLKQAAVASARLGLKAHATFSGSLARRFSIRGRRTTSSAFRRRSVRWRPAGGRFWIPSTSRAWTSALSCIRGRSARRRHLRAFSGAGGQPSAL